MPAWKQGHLVGLVQPSATTDKASPGRWDSPRLLPRVILPPGQALGPAALAFLSSAPGKEQGDNSGAVRTCG